MEFILEKKKQFIVIFLFFLFILLLVFTFKGEVTFASMLEDSYDDRGITSDWTKDALEEYEDSSSDEKLNRASNNGKILAKAMMDGLIVSELNYRFKTCPFPVISLIDQFVQQEDHVLDLEKCKDQLKSLETCSVGYYEFVGNPQPCIEALGMPASKAFEQNVEHCESDSSGAACDAYKRLAAKLSYLDLALED
jgi:hypothetical protein